MKRVSKVAISLPSDLLEDIDVARHRAGESRSQYFRAAAAARLAETGQDAEAEYRAGYERQPESAEEIDAAMQSALVALASEPWS